MKKMVLVILVTINLHGTRHELLRKAIRNGEVQKVHDLIQQSKPKVRSEHTPLKEHEDINLDELHVLAQSLLEEKKQASQSLKNRYVFKRFAISIATIFSSWVPLGVATYNGITSSHWPSGETLFAAIIAGISGTYHGVDQMLLGLNNEDAKSHYAKHSAIVQITSKAKDDVGPTEIS
jgi:hypothetical protein